MDRDEESKKRGSYLLRQQLYMKHIEYCAVQCIISVSVSEEE